MAACDDTGDSGEQLVLDNAEELDACSHSTNSRPLLLDTLKCPETSVLTRNCKVKTNTPVGAKRSQCMHSLP